MGDKFKVVKNTTQHGFIVGQIVELCDNPAELDDGSKMYFNAKMHWAWYCKPCDVRPYLGPWWIRLYRAIFGALFGPESHAVNRYEK